MHIAARYSAPAQMDYYCASLLPSQQFDNFSSQCLDAIQSSAPGVIVGAFYASSTLPLSQYLQDQEIGKNLKVG